MPFLTMADVRAAYPRQFDAEYLREMGITPGRKLYGGQFFVQRHTAIYDKKEHGETDDTFLFQSPLRHPIELVECVHRYNIIEVSDRCLTYSSWQPSFRTSDAADRYIRRELLPPPPPTTRFERALGFKI